MGVGQRWGGAGLFMPFQAVQYFEVPPVFNPEPARFWQNSGDAVSGDDAGEHVVCAVLDLLTAIEDFVR